MSKATPQNAAVPAKSLMVLEHAFGRISITLAGEIGRNHTNPKRQRGSGLAPRWRFGFVLASIATASGTMWNGMTAPETMTDFAPSYKSDRVASFVERAARHWRSPFTV